VADRALRHVGLGWRRSVQDPSSLSRQIRRLHNGGFSMPHKTKRPGKPGRFVPCAMLLVLVDAAPQFTQLRRTIFRFARSS
jgi:hypothetical protein